MTSLVDIVRRVETLGAAVSLGGRTLLSLDTNDVPKDWTHITKVDPEPSKQLPLAYPLYLQQTSAVSVGGSSDITGEVSEETFELITAADVPAFHEPSAARHVTDRTRELSSFLAIPEVLNGDSQALVGILGEGIEYAQEELALSMIDDKLPVSPGEAIESRLADFAAGWLLRESVFEAYIIMNPDSAAAREANVSEADLLTPRQAKQRALAAEYHLDSEIIYLEYSGTFGGDEAVDILEAIDDAVSYPRIWYGGGLDDRTNVNKVRNAGADAVVVGDIFHDIAEVERDLYEVAAEEFETRPTDERLQTWVRDEVDVEETSATRYLSTIPDVTQPAERGVESLAAGVGIALGLRDIADGLDDPSTQDIDHALEGADVPGGDAFANVLGEDARPVARMLGQGLLAERFDIGDVSPVARHLAIDV